MIGELDLEKPNFSTMFMFWWHFDGLDGMSLRSVPIAACTACVAFIHRRNDTSYTRFRPTHQPREWDISGFTLVVGPRVRSLLSFKVLFVGEAFCACSPAHVCSMSRLFCAFCWQYHETRDPSPTVHVSVALGGYRGVRDWFHRRAGWDKHLQSQVPLAASSKPSADHQVSVLIFKVAVCFPFIRDVLWHG